jgi:uncharacterized YigZ family protein
MEDSFLTINGESESLYKEKGSKFIGVAMPVQSEDEVKERLEELKKKYYDARHHCYAYILGKEGKKYRANDDGEPNHSAGDPILGQIRSLELTNTLVVVIRYFGGTKLGVSGLISAYKTAAQEALATNTIEKKIVKDHFKLLFKYELTNEVMRLQSDFETELINQNFTDTCELEIAVRLSYSNAFQEAADKIPELIAKKLLKD